MIDRSLDGLIFGRAILSDARGIDVGPPFLTAAHDHDGMIFFRLRIDPDISVDVVLFRAFCYDILPVLISICAFAASALTAVLTKQMCPQA